jgi:hypothetical protein
MLQRHPTSFVCDVRKIAMKIVHFPEFKNFIMRAERQQMRCMQPADIRSIGAQQPADFSVKFLAAELQCKMRWPGSHLSFASAYSRSICLTNSPAP